MEDALIYDIGMHNGNDTAFYLAGGFRVIAVEADPDLVAAANMRFKAEIEAKRLIILNIAIAENATTAEFWINEKRSALNSFSRKLAARDGEPHHSILVPCGRLDQLLAKYGVPFYIKIDIEGNDLICCNQLSSGNKPEYISVEMSHEDLLLKLRDLGYDRFKLINQHNLQPVESLNLEFHVRIFRRLYRIANYHPADRGLFLRFVRAIAANILRLATALGLWEVSRPFKSRMLPEWNFAPESIGTYSGTFGKDLPGKWLTWEQAASIWNREMREYQKMGKELCCDLHATTGREN